MEPNSEYDDALLKAVESYATSQPVIVIAHDGDGADPVHGRWLLDDIVASGSLIATALIIHVPLDYWNGTRWPNMLEEISGRYKARKGLKEGTNRARAVDAVNRSPDRMTQAEAEKFADDLIVQLDQAAGDPAARLQVRAVLVNMFRRMAVYERDYSVALHESLLERKPKGSPT